MTELLPNNRESLTVKPVFVVFDLDRTLLDSAAVATALMSGLERFGVTPQEISELQAYEIAQRGQGLDLIDLIERRFEGRVDTAMIPGLLNETLGHEALYPGVEQLLERVAEADVPRMIMTYGSARFQSIKLDLLRSLVNEDAMPPAQIIDHQAKARYLETVCLPTEAGCMIPEAVSGQPPFIAERIVVLDDKPSNLASDNDHIEGILVDNDSPDQTRWIGAVTLTRLGAA